MPGRIVEVAQERRYLCISRGFMLVKDVTDGGAEVGCVPLDDIDAVIANAHGLSYSNNLLVALAERGAPFVLCGDNHKPAGILWPVDGNFQQARRFDAQLAVTRPLQKRLWAEIVRAKLQMQGAVLQATGAPEAPLQALAAKVRSGDPDNLEAQGARRYWTLLFGPAFRRNRHAGDINALLNYGYTVLRATTARGIIAAGLHPTLGIHHRNEGNAMRLVDDLMEPFRPVMDLLAWRLGQLGHTEINADTKSILASAMYADMKTSSGATPLTVCLQRLATSLVGVYLGKRKKLALPRPALPATLINGSVSN